MENKKSSIFIVSLNSKKLKIALDYKDDCSLTCTNQNLDVFVFDVMEALNGIFLHERNIAQQSSEIDKLINELQDQFINASPINRKLIKCSQIRKELNPYISLVYQEYYLNQSFERHCKNQIFQNLQPKLRRYGIASNKSSLLEVLIPFLLTEIGLFLSIFDKGNHQVIYGLEPEMEIMKAIKTHKYKIFTPFIKFDVQYKQINTRTDAGN